MKYIDGFVLAVQKKNLPAYRRMALAAGKIWRRCGALEYYECVGDDLHPKGIVLTFPSMVRLKKGEVVVFSFIVYRSRAHRDAVNKKVMADPAMDKMPKKMPFDFKRMAYAGFKPIVEM